MLRCGMEPQRYSIVVPCFNEEPGIASTIATLRTSVGAEPEVIVVDDGSTDRTAALLTELAAKDARLRVVRHERNRGYGASLKTGIARARAELIVIVDADGTYPLDRIPELVDACRDADMVVGARTGADVTYPLHRRVPKAFLSAHAEWLVGQRIPDMNSGLRVFRKDSVRRFIRVLPDGFSFTTTITMAMMRSHLDVRFVPISYKERLGRSKIRPIRDTLNFVQLIVRTGMIFAPLRVLGPIVVLLFAAFCVSLGYDVIVLENLTDKTVMLLLFALNTAMFALLADMIDRRSGS